MSRRAAGRSCRRACGRACGAAPSRPCRAPCRRARRRRARGSAPSMFRGSATMPGSASCSAASPSAAINVTDRIAVFGVEALRGMRHRVERAGDAEAERQAQRQLRIVEHHLGQDLRVAERGLHAVGGLAEDVGHLRPGIGGGDHDLRQVGAVARSPCRGRWSTRRRPRPGSRRRRRVPPRPPPR